MATVPEIRTIAPTEYQGTLDTNQMTFERMILLIAGGVLIVLILFMDKCFDLDIWLYRKWGWNAYADKWEGRKQQWVRGIRWFCGILAVGFILCAFFAVG